MPDTTTITTRETASPTATQAGISPGLHALWRPVQGLPWHSASRAQRKLQADYARLLSVYLREPSTEIQRLLTLHARFQQQLECRRNQCQSVSSMRQHLRRFHFSQHADYARLLRADLRSRIVVTYHCGDFVYGMHTLVHSAPHPGQVKVLSLASASAACWHNVRAGFGAQAHGPEAELLIAATSAADVSAYLRSGSNTLLVFCDLPAGNGAVASVKFLRRTAWFPKGPATLAVLNRVPLLPVITYTHRGQNEIVLFPQIESARETGEPLSACVSRITQQLIDILERFFIQYPAQWRYLQALPRYFEPPDAAQT